VDSQINLVKVGVDGDLSNYIPNNEWTLMKLRAECHVKHYSCCAEPYPDITYTIQVCCFVPLLGCRLVKSPTQGKFLLSVRPKRSDVDAYVSQVLILVTVGKKSIDSHACKKYNSFKL